MKDQGCLRQLEDSLTALIIDDHQAKSFHYNLFCFQLSNKNTFLLSHNTNNYTVFLSKSQKAGNAIKPFTFNNPNVYITTNDTLYTNGHTYQPVYIYWTHKSVGFASISVPICLNYSNVHFWLIRVERLFKILLDSIVSSHIWRLIWTKYQPRPFSCLVSQYYALIIGNIVIIYLSGIHRTKMFQVAAFFQSVVELKSCLCSSTVLQTFFILHFGSECCCSLNMFPFTILKASQPAAHSMIFDILCSNPN